MPLHGAVAKTVWRVIRCSSVLKFSACKFSEEKMNEIVATLCKSICLETLILHNLKNRYKPFATHRLFTHAFHLLFFIFEIQNYDDCFLWNILFDKKKTVTISSTMIVLFQLI